MELGGCKPLDFSGERACAQRARLPAVATTLHQTYAHPSRPANAAAGPRSEPTWSVGSWQLGAERGSYVGTDAAPGQSGPFATFSPEDVCHRGPELHAPHREPALDIGGLCLFRFISFTCVPLVPHWNDLVCPEPAFSQRKYLCLKMERKISYKCPHRGA